MTSLMIRAQAERQLAVRAYEVWAGDPTPDTRKAYDVVAALASRLCVACGVDDDIEGRALASLARKYGAV